MKKVSLLILVSLILLMAFASCDMLPPLFGEEPEPEHVHDWMEATCEAPKTCACGATEGEKLPHTWAEATCSSPKVCTFCNATEGTALNHNWVSADCETPATCTLCGTTSGEPTGHLWISASCDSAKHCANCNTVEGEPLEHNWVEATCLTPKTCTLCQATDGPALGHANETVPGYAATCKENGLTDGTVCTVCGQTTLAQQIIPALGHTESAWIEDLAPTCTEPGSKHKECTVCGTLLTTESLSALGHTETDWIVDLEATCDTKGSKHKECTVCGATTKTAAIPVLGHVEGKPVIENNVDPDCDDAGSYDEVVYCATCGDELSRHTNSVPALGHKMESATCLVPSTCSVCGHTEGTVVACKAGEAQKENVVDPRCEVEGSYDLATYCVWCNTELSRNHYTVDALEHDMAPATCTAPSTCKNGCGKTEGQPLEQHTIVVSSMSEDLLWYECSGCDAYFLADKALVYDGDKLPMLSKNGDPSITVTNGEYVVKAGAQKSQYMLYFPSNSKSHADMFTDFTGAKNSLGVLSFKFKAGNVTDTIRFIVMTARDNPNWDASGGWNGCSMDLLQVKPNGDGTYTVNGNNITSNVFATVSGDDWVDVKMFMQLTSDGMFRVSYYVNGAFCNVYERDLLNAGDAQTIKDLTIQSVYVCGWTEAGTGWVFDDLAFGYANDCEWVFDDHKHTWADATCTAPKTCTACGATEGDALGHNVVPHGAQAPTCTEIGWDAYETCSRCDYSTYVELPATGHNYGNATCDQAAACTVCGFTTGEALGHDFKADAYVYNNDAKCGVDGTKTAKCSRCDATDTKTAEGTALNHNWAGANCATASTCTLCGATQGEPNKAMHDKLTDTHVNGVTTYSCATCGYSFKVDIGDYMDGSSYDGMTCNAATNNNHYTTNADKPNYPVNKDGYYEFIRTELDSGSQKQVQVWLPTASGSNKFAGFNSANGAVGFLSFKVDAFMDKNFEMKLVDASLPNDYDVDGDGKTEYIRWTEYWGISTPVFSIGVPQNGLVALVGFGTHLTSVEVNEDNFTGWLDVDMRIVLDAETDKIYVDYYLGGKYIGSASTNLTICTNAITGVYINGNTGATGSGYRIDDLAFGYTAHKHDFVTKHENGVTTLTCDCGNTYKVEEGYYNDGTHRDFYYSANGTMPVNSVNGQHEAIFTPAVNTAPEAAGDGWAVNTNNKKLGGQHMWWIPTQTAGQGVQGFSCANNAVGLVSFKVQTNVDDPFAISLCKERGAADWNGWGTSETKLMYIGGYSASGIEIRDAKNVPMTTVPVADGWSEWIDVQVAIELHDNGTYDFYYYVNGALVGSLLAQPMNIDAKDFRALYINGWTYTPGTGVKLDDVVFGYSIGGHNTLDGQLHKLTEGANCGEKTVCSCGWSGYTQEHDFAEATCGAPATCKACGMTKGEALTHNNLTVQVEGENVKYYCADCNKYYAVDGKCYYLDGTSMDYLKDVSNSKDKFQVEMKDGAYVAINNANENIQAQMWVPTNNPHPDLDGFSCANNAIGFLSFRINSGIMGTQGNDNLTFVLAMPRNDTDNWAGWGPSDINILSFGAAKTADQDTISLRGGVENSAEIAKLPVENGWTGWLDVAVIIQLRDNNTITLSYYINDKHVGTYTGDMDIATHDIRSLHITGYTEVAGSGFMLDDLVFGYTLNGLHDAPVVEEPFYTEVIDAAKVQSETLKTIVASKIKQCDQANPGTDPSVDVFAEGGTPVYVLADKNGETVEALYFSRTVAWTGKETKQLFTEFRFDVDGTKKATSISFDYKIKGTVEKNDRFTFTDLEGNKFSADAYVQIKTPANHPLAGDNYPELQGTDLILDGEWHTMTYTFAEPLEIINVLVNLYKFQGQLLISNFNVEFEQPVVEEPFYNEVIDAANVQSQTLKTIVAGKIKQCDQANPSGKEDDLFAEGGTPVYVLADKNGETVEALYISRTVAWTGLETKQLFTEFRFAINGEKEGPAVTSISFDYKIDGTVEKNDRFTFTDFDGSEFSADAYVQVKTFEKVVENAKDQYPELKGTDLILDGEWHTFTYNFKTPRVLIDFLLNLYKFQGELLIANIEIEYYEEPFYTEVIDAAKVQSETLKTIVASKIKQCDQANPSGKEDDLFVEGGTPVYVLADKNGETVEALYISRTVAWTGLETKQLFTEFRFAINGEKEGPAVTSISFDYKIDGTVEKNDRFTFTDFDGSEFSADAYVQVKTFEKVVENAKDQYPELKGTDLILDGEWHTFTYNFETPRVLIDFLLNLYKFQGELLIANINVEFVEECQHTNVSTDKADATCTAAGYEKVTCDDCGATVSEKTFPATNHADKTTTTVDPTCTANGSNKVVCNDCGVTLVDEVLPATGHKLSAKHENGILAYTCSACNNSCALDEFYYFDGSNTFVNASADPSAFVANKVNGYYDMTAIQVPTNTQSQIWVPSNNAASSEFLGFTCENNALGFFSFDIKPLNNSGAIEIILAERRNDNGNWSGWETSSLNVLRIDAIKDNTVTLMGDPKYGTYSHKIATVSLDENEGWINVLIKIELTEDGNVTMTYYVNGANCGTYTEAMTVTPGVIRAAYIKCPAPNVGEGYYIDNIALGYNVKAHNTLEGEHNVLTEATCQAGATCSCGWIGEPVAHKLNYTAKGEGIVVSCAYGCGEGYTLDKALHTDGTNSSVLTPLAGNYSGGYTTHSSGAPVVSEEGYLVFARAEGYAEKGQFQLHAPHAAWQDCDRIFPDFSTEKSAVGVLDFNINLNLDTTGNLRFIITERVASGFAWGKNDITLLTFSQASADGKITLSGWGANNLATFQKGADGYTGWINIKVTIELSKNAKDENIGLVKFYVNGEHVGTTHSHLTTLLGGRINNLYITGNSTDAGTGFMLDDFVFGYTPHEHVYAEEVTNPTCTADGFTTFTCDCGHTYTGNTVAALGHNMSAATCTAPSTCANGCGTTEGEALGHADENGDYKCDRCSTKMLPEDGTALTIPEALAVAKAAGTSYSTQKYYITGIVTNVYNTTYGNLYLKDADGNKICIYGLYTWNKAIRYDKMEYKPIEGDELTVYTVLGMYSTTAQGKDAWIDEVVAHEHDYKSEVTAPTCVSSGFTTYTCSICNGSYQAEETKALGHTTEEGECERCGLTIGGAEPVIGVLATFDFGSNGSAAHVDGQSLGASKTYTSGSYSLALTSMANVYGPAYDAKGNSCIKLGASSKAGSLKFTVGDDVTEVVIYIAKYKSNASKLTINGTSYTLTKNSNDGAYDVITIDTSVNKTVTIATASGGYRSMLNTIEFKGVVG